MQEKVPKLPHVLVRFIAMVLTWILPLLLVLVSVRLLMTPTYLKLAYARPGFPADAFGWPDSVRKEYGPYGVRYLTSDADISYLADLQIDGEPAFTSRELRHMQDVKSVVQASFLALRISALIFVLGTAALLFHKETRLDWLLAIQRGGMQTLVIFVSLGMIALLSWNFFFDTFHAIFFKAGTWEFYYSDTLIRLYPQQFWFDSALVIAAMTIISALLCIFLPRRWLTVQSE